MAGFNTHLPFLHIPSLDLSQMTTSLLLSICSIGALYRVEEPQATTLHSMAVILLRMVNPFAHHSTYKKEVDELSDREIPNTSTIQSMVICLCFAIWSGDLGLFRRSISFHALLGYVPSSFSEMLTSSFCGMPTSLRRPSQPLPVIRGGTGLRQKNSVGTSLSLFL